MSKGKHGAIFDGVEEIINKGLLLKEGEGINQVDVSERIKSIPQPECLLNDLYRQIEGNILKQNSSTSSKEIWKLRRAAGIGDENGSKEKILEKSVALLAEKKCMPGWYNQLPVASGVMGSSTGGKISIDLVRESKGGAHFQFIELKWCGNKLRPPGDKPLYAMFEILRYGLVYLFFHVHAKKYAFEGEEVMKAREVELEVLAPQNFFGQHDQSAIYDSLSPVLDKLAREKTKGKLSMSLDAKMFPPGFQCPLDFGKEIKGLCNGNILTQKGEKIRSAFENRASVKWK